VVFVALWTVMMAAMMLPAAALMVLIFASAQARRARFAAVPTWIFIAGYLLVWAAAGVLVYVLVQVGSDLATGLTSADRASWAPVALGATLLAAGLYQFGPLKRVCLVHCRSPSWRSTGAMAGWGRCAWGCATAPIASTAAGRCSR
jgi:predicted metal-binding membrane protein